MGTSLSDWMSDADYHWRQRLEPVNLVIETDFSADEVREAQRNVGRAAQHLLNNGWSHGKIIKRYPALTLVTLVGHAALAYDHGAYWESFWDEIGVTRNAEFEGEIRRQLIDLLDKFSLARFPDIERDSNRKYVMTLALHAGIPVYCLKDLLAIISDHIVQGRPAAGAAVVEWLQEPGKEYRANALDVPVRNFLVNGAEFAADILDRMIEFIEATTADPALFDADLDSSTTGLPNVLLDELILQLKESPLRLERKRLNVSTAMRPAVVYGVDDDEIVLMLPTPPEGAELPWRVSFDGDVREVHATRRWGGDAHTAMARVAVPGPVREVVVTHPVMPNGFSLPLVLQSDPLLAFDTAGRWVGRHDGLKDCAWFVYPEDHQLVELRTSKAVLSQDAGWPAGWRGWRSAFVDLEDVDALQLMHAEAPVGTPRSVRKDLRPRFQLGSRIAGLTTSDGRSVHGTRPWVILPPTRTDPAPAWNVRVRRFGDTDWILEEAWHSEDGETCVDPFDGVEDAQLGLFEVVVSGPLGADARCVVLLAEGVDTRFEPTIRVTSSGGLTPCTAIVETGQLMVSSVEPITFGPLDLETTLELSSGDVRATLVLKPPHVEIRSGESGMPVAWRMSADVCDPEDFSQDRFVALRAPGVADVAFGYQSDLRDLLQVDAHPRRRQGDVFETRIQQFADTVRAYPTGRLVATMQTDDGPVSVTVLSPKPRQLATGIELIDDAVVFTDLADIEDLAVYVWSNTAPWHGPEVLPVLGNRATLPEHLVGRGELRCQLFVDDPWVHIERPTAPNAAAFRAHQFGWRDDGTPEQVLLSRFLGGPRKAPVEVGAIPEVWAALARLHADGEAKRFAELIVLLAGEPRKALECLGDSTIPVGEKMSMLVRSELVNHNFAVEETFNVLHTHPWFGCMVELADLPSLHRRRHKVRDERAETLAYLRERGGAPLMELLQSGKSAQLHDASFDRAIFELSVLPGNNVESKLREMQQVPRAQLHPENLHAGAYEGLCHRSEWLASGWSPNFESQTSAVLTPIRKVSRLAHDVITMRIDRLRGIDTSEHPWLLMSVQSLTLALLARLEAHGRVSGQYLNSGLLRDWAQMAQLCPTMVANDVMIAEALVLFDRKGDLTGEDE
jgi:hypothetical protein